MVIGIMMVRPKLVCGIDRRNIGVFWLGVVLLCSLSSCIPSVTPHENFKHHMQHNVGKKADSPHTYILRYSEYVLGSRQMANGNKEITYQTGRGRSCIVYFEVDKETNIIIDWRFTGSEEACAIVP